MLSDKPPRDEKIQATFEVHGAATVRATKPLNSTTKILPFEAWITAHAQRQRVAADLVRAVIQVESAFNPIAVSSKGAMGLMQLMPATATELGVGQPLRSRSEHSRWRGVSAAIARPLYRQRGIGAGRV